MDGLSTKPGIEGAMMKRVEALVTRFCEIGNTQMADLPIYNGRLTVEAVGFRPLGDDAWIGVLITPWFMNAIVLPREKQDLDDAELGRAAVVELPAGQTKFRTGGDEEIGAFRSLSLHSPMSAFAFQEAAHVEADKALVALLAPPEDKTPSPPGTEDEQRKTIGRRQFLRGRRSG